VLTGDLTSEERRRLLIVSRYCPIHKIISHGIEVDSRLGESSTPGETA
jgi:uncharacterized OsmC-like protein